MNLVEGTFGGLGGEEIELFRKVIGGMEGIGVEIGCMDGYSTAHILECSNLHLTSIDPFIGDSCAPHLIGKKERFLANVEPWKDRSALIEGYSFQAVVDWQQMLDFLFIDGDHGYMAVMRDHDQWTRFLKVGGILAMHDSRMYRPGGANFHPGPSMVARDLVYGKPDKWEIVGEAFSLTVARKKA
jgi:hypothetical protein